jgi:hypothetical protein
MVGGAALAVFDTHRGDLAWRRSAPAAGLPRACRGNLFHPRYLAGPEFVVVQTTDGRRWTLGAATGHTVHDDPTTDVPWPQAPLAVGDHRAILAESCDGGAPYLRMVDLADGGTVWRFDPPRWPSLTNELPRFRREGDRLLICVGRNYGTELEQLDLVSGCPVGPAVFLGRYPVEPGGVLAVDDDVVLAAGGELRRLSSKGVRWRCLLTPTADWRLFRVEGSVCLAVPAAAVALPVGFTWPVLAVDEETGAVVRRWDFAPRGPRAAVALNGSVSVRLDGEVSALTAAGRGER